MVLSCEEIHIPHHEGPRFLRMGLVLPASYRRDHDPAHGAGDGGYQVHRYSGHHLPAVWVPLVQFLDRLQRERCHPHLGSSMKRPQSIRILPLRAIDELFGWFPQPGWSSCSVDGPFRMSSMMVAFRARGATAIPKALAIVTKSSRDFASSTARSG